MLSKRNVIITIFVLSAVVVLGRGEISLQMHQWYKASVVQSYVRSFCETNDGIPSEREAIEKAVCLADANRIAEYQAMQ